MKVTGFNFNKGSFTTPQLTNKKLGGAACRAYCVRGFESQKSYLDGEARNSNHFRLVLLYKKVRKKILDIPLYIWYTFSERGG